MSSGVLEEYLASELAGFDERNSIAPTLLGVALRKTPAASATTPRLHFEPGRRDSSRTAADYAKRCAFI